MFYGVKFFNADKETSRLLRASQIEEGKAWLERAEIHKDSSPFFSALMAGRAIGFVGYGRERLELRDESKKPFIKDNPKLLTDGADFQTALGYLPEDQYLIPIWQSPVPDVHKSDVNSVAFSPDGKTLATGSRDATVKLWNVSDGRELRTLLAHQDSVSSVAFSPDGKTLATGSWDNTVKVWNVSDGRELRTLLAHQDSVSSVAFSPDGKTLATGSRDAAVKLWNVSDGRELRTLQAHQSFVSSVAFSPDGKTLATGSSDNTVKLWNVSDGRELRTLQAYQRSCHQRGVQSRWQDAGHRRC